MTKRQFLKAAGALVAGNRLSTLVRADSREGRTNWAGNYRYKAARLDAPASVAELRRIVKERDQVKALGSRHSFNNIADTAGDQISLEHFTGMSLDAKSRTVTVGAGINYGQLALYLEPRGYALHNLASLPHVTVAGACSTATHGSGNENRNLSSAVAAVEFVNAEGDLVTFSRDRDGDRFCGAVVGLGALGVITNITVDVEPTYQVRQVVYRNLSMDRLEHRLDEIFGAGYSVSLFTDWQDHNVDEVWVKTRVEPNRSFQMPADFFGAKPATRKLHPVEAQSADKCTEQMGIPGPWYDRLPHFRLNATPSTGNELQTEYVVPRERGYEAIRAVESLRDHITPLLFITELRTIAADDLWMSTAYRRDSLGIHFTWKPEWQSVKNVLPTIEEQLAPFGARPHWAKVFTMAPAQFGSSYEKMSDYKALVREHDPRGKFRNAYLKTNIFGG